MKNYTVLTSFKESALSIPFGNKQKLRLVVRKLMRYAQTIQSDELLKHNMKMINDYMLKYHETESMRLKMQYWNIMIAIIIESIDEIE